MNQSHGNKNKLAMTTALALALATACTSIRYETRGDDVRLGGPMDGEQVVRHVKESVSEHYFLFGLVGNDFRDPAAVVQLGAGEALVNTRITNQVTFVDGLIMGVLGGISAGLVYPLIWQKRTTVIEGDVVKKASLMRMPTSSGEDGTREPVVSEERTPAVAELAAPR